MFGRIVRWLAKRAASSAPDLHKRAALRARPVPPAWHAFVDELPQTRRLSPAQRKKLAGDIHVFLGEKEVVGEDGFVVDDRARVIVAASAALLVLARDISLFDHVRRVVIKPAVAESVGGHYVQMEATLGGKTVETWAVVELGWNAIEASLVRAEGQHTLFHEFAHAFDDADGKLDALRSHQHYERWRTLLHELPLHRRIDGDHIYTEVIGDVAGPELFASATELFFECPKKLFDLDASLFTTLVEIYGFDPRQLTTP